MDVQIRAFIPVLRSLGSFVVRFATIDLIFSALLTTTNRVFGVTWWIILFVLAGVTLLVLVGVWKGIFISPWSLRLRTVYRKYSHFGVVSLFGLFKSRRRRVIEFVKGFFLVIIGISSGPLLSFLLKDVTFSIQGSVLGIVWQVHAVIIGFSFVALTLAWEEVSDNSLSDELTRLFVEDIGSIWTVTFVFGANLVLGFITFRHSSAETVGNSSIYITAILFTTSILIVAKRFLDALDLLFYTDLDEKVKNFAKEDLEKEVISTSSTPNQVLAESVSGFDQVSVPLANFGLERTTISSRDLGKRGTVTDISLRRMRQISEIVDQEDRASIDKNPTIDSALAEDTAVLSLEGDISEESQEQIKRQLRRGLRTRGGN